MVIVTDVSSLDDQDPEDINKQHMRGMELLRSILQVDAILAGALVLALLGKDHEQLERPQERVQVVLQAVTCSVFLSAVAHTALLMASTGRRYTLARYDPIFSLGFSAAGFLLLYVTIADAVLIAFRPVEDINTAGFWCFVIFGMCLPMFLAGPLVVLQMVLPTFTRDDDSGVH